MTQDEFENLFDADEIAELEKLGKDVAQQSAAPKKDGVWYAGDEQDGNGHTLSTYAVNANGKTLLWIWADNDVEVSRDDIPELHVPSLATAHWIWVANARRTHWVKTRGVALRYPHGDGSGTHIDGNTLRMYVGPRVGRWLAEFYGV